MIFSWCSGWFSSPTMSDTGYKIKGHQRSRAGTPYVRRQGLVGKVKHWFSWSNYFRSGEDPPPPLQDQVPVATPYQVPNQSPPSMPTHQTLNEAPAHHRPQKSEALTSDNISMDDRRNFRETNHAQSSKSTHRPFRKLLTPFSTSGSAVSSLNNFSATPSSGQAWKLSTHPLNNVLSKPRVQDAGESTDESDISWVAEAGEPDQVDRKKENTTNSGDESWIAEDEQPGPSNGPHPVSRPVSISLAQKELSHLAETDSPSTPLYAYIVGEGRPSVAEQSSFLLTPRAEMTVQCVANPVYADRSPEVAFPDSNAAITQARRPVLTPGRRMYGASSQPAATQPGATPALDRGQEGDSSSRNPPAHLKPSTKKSGTPNSRTPHPQTQPSFPGTSFLSSLTEDTRESIRRSPFKSPFYSGRTVYGGAASSQKMRFKRARIETSPPPRAMECVTVRPSVAPVSTAPRISETAKRILSSLQPSNSPLSEARRMPMRQQLPEDQMSWKIGGKLRSSKRSQHHFSRKSSQEEVDAFVNPIAPPPSVGLGSGKSLSGIKFHAAKPNACSSGYWTRSSSIFTSGVMRQLSNLKA